MVVAVLGVQDGRCHREKSVQSIYSTFSNNENKDTPVTADGHQVEYGGGAADHVHGKVEVAHRIRQVPVTPVGLWTKKSNQIKFLPEYQIWPLQHFEQTDVAFGKYSVVSEVHKQNYWYFRSG